MNQGANFPRGHDQGSVPPESISSGVPNQNFEPRASTFANLNPKSMNQSSTAANNHTQGFEQGINDDRPPIPLKSKSFGANKGNLSPQNMNRTRSINNDPSPDSPDSLYNSVHQNSNQSTSTGYDPRNMFNNYPISPESTYFSASSSVNQGNQGSQKMKPGYSDQNIRDNRPPESRYYDTASFPNQGYFYPPKSNPSTTRNFPGNYNQNIHENNHGNSNPQYSDQSYPGYDVYGNRSFSFPKENLDTQNHPKGYNPDVHGSLSNNPSKQKSNASSPSIPQQIPDNKPSAFSDHDLNRFSNKSGSNKRGTTSAQKRLSSKNPSSESQTSFDALGNQSNFGAHFGDQTSFGAPFGNQTKFDFPGNQSFNLPSENLNQPNSNAPPGIHNFSPRNQTDISPENQYYNDFDAFPENQYDFDNFTSNFDQEPDNFDLPSEGNQSRQYQRILSVIEGHKYYHVDRINFDYSNDLVDYIPGMYRLLDLCKDDGSNGLVDKIIISKDSLKKLCDDLVPYSFSSISEIDYNLLNNITIRLAGCYGNHTLISKLMLNKRIINRQLFDCLTTSTLESVNKPSLRPGIYLLIINPNVGLIIYWPEPGSYEESAPSQRRKNMANMHRYITKLTDHQLCFISGKDLECIEWNSDIENLNSDEEDNNNRTYEFEVKKSQEEQEDFKFFKGFEVNIPSSLRTNLIKREHNNIALSPMVVESTHKQTFVTREIIKSSSTILKRYFTVSRSTLYNELQMRLRNKALRINRGINIENLKVLVKHGLKKEVELIGPMNLAIEAARHEIDLKKEREREALKFDGELIEETAYKLLRSFYGRFEKDFLPNSFDEDYDENCTIDLEQFDKKYSGMSRKLRQCVQINIQSWLKLKRRFFYAKILVCELISGTTDESIKKQVYNAFFDVLSKDENHPYTIYKEFSEKMKSGWKSGWTSGWVSGLLNRFFNLRGSNVETMYKQAVSSERSTPDERLIRDLEFSEFFDSCENIRKLTSGLFYTEYSIWRKNVFPTKIKELIPKVSDSIRELTSKFEEEFRLERGKVMDKERERIIDEIESMYPTGQRFRLVNITGSSISSNDSYIITCEEEISQPDQLQINIYETSLEQSDNFQSQMDELYIPRPKLSYGSSSFSGNFGISFQINPEVHDLRKIFQFENRKFLVITWNKKLKRTEMFYELASGLKSAMQTNPPKLFKHLNTPENCYFAINEPKGFIGIYDKDHGELNVYAFNEERNSLFSRNPNIQIRQWYNSVAPDIRHFFFIQDTEELCFIENGGRARVYNLVTNQFRSSVGQIPVKTINVMSTPDGACIVAFVKEKASAKERSTEDTENDDDESEILSEGDEDESEILRAYVYFCSNFGQKASKIIELPQEFRNLECLQFSFLNKYQMHLLSLDFEKRLFYSSIVKITLEKTQFRFQQRMKKNPLGRVKLSSTQNNYSRIQGTNTHFKRDIKIGENIVLMGEKYCVLEIISDTMLKVAGTFKPKIESSWIDFQIEPKTKLNGYIDAYKSMFEKYPIDGCVDGGQVKPLSLQVILDISDESKIEKYQEEFEGYVTEMFTELKRSTKKPAIMLKKFKTDVSTFNNLDLENSKFLKKNSREFQLGEWIIQLSCLIPIQIAVARNNQFIPLRDGLSTEMDQFDLVEGCGNHVDNIAQNISFGWYEGIFKHFGNRKVKVVSSMGEQSCGKSYMLNHLVGTTFDGSAMRCTEGAWMSLAITPEYIYVVLDFEGLRSLERTPQEDLFLTLLNTVVSNLILFKNQFSINRDMSSMFQRFQDGALLLNDPKLFQAKLCIIIKDVPSQDKDDIVREFTLRFNTLVAEEGEDNFITKMYPSGLVILPWALFSDAAWYKNLKDVKRMLDKQEARYENARTFLQNIKVIMAKLKICDWRSLDENLVQIRVANLRRFIQTAIALGIEQKNPHEPLMNCDTGLEIEDPTVLISDVIDDYDQTTELLNDSDLLLYDDEPVFLSLSKDLITYFEEKIQLRDNSTDDNKWFAKLEKFLKYITERRIYRVQKWFSQNVSKFPQDNSDIVIGKYSLEQEISKFSLFWTLCGLTCHNCGLKCMKNRDHADGQHDCLTDHECHANCQFIEAHPGSIPPCSYKAAHSGKHTCNQTNHLCGEVCNLSSKRNCQKKCAKEIGHDDGIHLCQANRHYCGEPCSLKTRTQKGDYECPNQCIIPCEDDHDSHHCENDNACPIQCPIPDCQRRCQSSDHFHAFSELVVNHFCGQDHPCQEECEEPGVCKVQTEPKKQEEVYKGLVSTITFMKYTQVSERLRCKIRIPANSFVHPGKHSHDENASAHYCDAQCKYCEYYCTLPYGHTQRLHETTHGNMIQTVFTAEDNEEFEYRGHKLKTGDQGTFVLCSLHCKDTGRHRHIDYCQDAKNCKNTKDLQHIQGKIEPNPDQPKDYISHRLFWERTGFKDPYSAQELAEFVKCDHECSDKKHKQADPSNQQSTAKPSFCQLDLFHDPADNTNPPGGYGYVSLDGHHFNCDNPVKREATFHIVLVLDRSGSMSGTDKKPISGTPVYQQLIQAHNNRTGAVYSAVYSFLETRIATVKAGSSPNVAAAIKDTVSLILFDHNSEIILENKKLDNSNYFIQEMIKHQARGGTDFSLAIQKTGTVIDKYFDPQRTNIIIFCSDGECGIPEGQLKQICMRNKQKGSPLYLYTILFGSDTYGSSLKRMAEIANEFHPASTSSSSLKCQFSHILTEVNLVNHLTGVAMSLRSHKQALLKM